MMRKNRTQKLSPLQQKRLWRAGALITLSAVLWLLFAPEYGVFSLIGKRSELRKLQVETDAIAEENKELAEEIDRLKTDPAYLEEVARRDYGLLKKHERVYDFSERSKEE